MDSKNVIAAIALSSAVIVLYSLFFVPEKPISKQNNLKSGWRPWAQAQWARAQWGRANGPIGPRLIGPGPIGPGPIGPNHIVNHSPNNCYIFIHIILI